MAPFEMINPLPPAESAANRDAPQLHEKLTDLGHLAGGVGHHVINAFSAIVSNAELLRLKSPSKAGVDPAVLAETIIQTSLEAATVARRLIDFTRPLTTIESRDSAGQIVALTLDRLAGEIVAVEESRGRPGIVWAADLQPVPPIIGHETQLRAMIGHLIANAYEAMPGEGGTVGISTATDTRGWVVLEIRDSGRGMEGEVMRQAVEPFFSTKPSHLGVGLSIANGIWRRHRGTLSIRSQPGEGTTVRLCVMPPPV